MKTGMCSLAHSSHTGSRSGSSSLSRVPSAFLMDKPNCLPTSPTPTAPARMSASSCVMARSAQPGPTFRKLIPANASTLCGERRERKRQESCCGDKRAKVHRDSQVNGRRNLGALGQHRDVAVGGWVIHLPPDHLEPCLFDDIERDLGSVSTIG